MGLKSSIITISHPSTSPTERELLDRLGFTDFEPAGDTTLEEAIYPMDQSLNIGYHNDCIVICDDYQLSDELSAADNITTAVEYELTLAGLFPGSEILTTACHSGANFHTYSLVKDGKRLRFKEISSESPVREYGHHLPEEDLLYKESKVVDGVRLFKSDFDEEGAYEYEEDQKMEAFTFGVAKRHLGVRFDRSDMDDPIMDVALKKYRKSTNPVTPGQQHTVSPDSSTETTSSWLARLLKKIVR